MRILESPATLDLAIELLDLEATLILLAAGGVLEQDGNSHVDAST